MGEGYGRAVKPAAVVRAEAALGAGVESWQPVSARIGNDRGRWLVRLVGGGSAFVKAPYDEASGEWLRTEALVYQAVEAEFLPRLLAWDGEVLMLEDLSDAVWPPPWTPAAVASVRATLADVAMTTPPAGLPPLANLHELLVNTDWPAIESDPEAFSPLVSAAPDGSMLRFRNCGSPPRPSNWAGTRSSTSTSVATTSACATVARSSSIGIRHP